jgi:glycosyltransferase involved in cell wall biosynthesis
VGICNLRIVANVHATDPTGGVELSTLQITRNLASRGHEIDLLFPDYGSLIPEYEQFCRKLHHVPRVGYGYPVGWRYKLEERGKQVPAILEAVRARPDIIYASRSFSAGWAVPARRITRAPVVCHLRGGSEIAPLQARTISHRIDRFIAVSRHTAEFWIEAGLDEAKVEVVHNGVDPADYPPGGLDARAEARRSLGVDPDAYTVVYIGRLDPEKGVDVLLDAWKILSPPTGEGQLLLVGQAADDGYLHELESMATATVTFLGLRRDVVTPLHASDVTVVPSVYDEPFGRTVIEGLATGRPVVASRVGGIPEILSGPLSRFLVDPGDAEALAAQLEALRGWDSKEPNLGTECLEHFTNRFTLSRTVDQVEAILNSTLQER